MCVFSSSETQVSLHRLPVQAKTYALCRKGVNRGDMGARSHHNVSLGVNVDRRPRKRAFHGSQWQQHIPAVLLLRDLARPGDEESVHHRLVCTRIRHSPGAHHAHVRPDQRKAVRHSHRGQRRAARCSHALQMSCVSKKDPSDKDADCGGSALHAVLAAAVDAHAADRLRPSRRGQSGAPDQLYIPSLSLAGLLQFQRQPHYLWLLQRELQERLPGRVSASGLLLGPKEDEILHQTAQSWKPFEYGC